MIVGAPLMAMLPLRLSRRLTLMLTLGPFALGHLARRACLELWRGCRRKREQSLPVASLWLLAQESDVDPARVP